MQDVVLAANGSELARLPSRGEQIRKRGVLSLVAAGIWVAPHYWGGGATHALGSWRASLVLLAGASLTLFAVVLCWGAPGQKVAGQRVSALSAGLALATLPVGVLAYAIYTLSHHRPLGAVLLSAGSLALGALGLFLFQRIANCLPRRRTTAWLLGFGGLACLAMGLSAQGLAGGVALLWEAALPWRDLWLGLGLAAAVALGPASFIPRAMGTFSLWGHGAVVALAFWLTRTDPSLVETLRSAPLVAGVLGLIAL